MTRHPDAVGIYAANDEEAQGAIAVLKALGLQPGVDVIIASAGDGNPEAAEAIKKGLSALHRGQRAAIHGGDDGDANLRRDERLEAARGGADDALGFAHDDNGECRRLS